MGYVIFPQPKMAKFASHQLAPVLKFHLDGKVEVTPLAESYDLYINYLRQRQLTTHGMGLFEQGDRETITRRNNWWVAQAKAGDQLLGMMLYDLQGENIMKFKFRATRFYYDSSAGRYLFLQWIARHIDQADRAEIWLPPTEYPETWLADLRPEMELYFFAPMGRVLDVAALAGMQVGEGKFSVRISDPLCPWNEGTWAFASDSGSLAVNHAGNPACDLTIQGLSALIYGTHDPADFAILGWGKPPAETQRIMRSVFPMQVPYLHELF